MLQSSIWELESFYDQKDVIIVGSGFGGLWSAYYLKQLNPKANILIVDRGIIPSGASTRNAGFACFGSVTELLDDARKMGEDKMLELVAMRYEGLRCIKKLFGKKEIDFERNGGYELITKQQYSSLKRLKNDIGWLNILLRKVIKEERIFRLTDKKISEFGFRQIAHLIQNKSEGQLHSGKLIQSLLQMLQETGVKVMNNIEVKGFEKAGGKIELVTNLPVKLNTQQLLICTNAFASQLLPNADIVPNRGQILLTSPIKRLPFKGTFHFEEGFYYFRNLGNRVLLGGARNKAFKEEETTELIISDTIQKELERFLHEILLSGKSYTIDHRWSGIMGMGRKKFPTVKQVKPNIFCAVGMGGMGVAIAPVVGKKVAQLMTGKGA